jgi:predicted nucleic-acid-binding protein
MIGLDTNVLLRFLVEDDADQHARAAALVRRALRSGEDLFVAKIVLCEVIWVLQRSYGVDRQGLVEVVEGLLRTRSFVLEDREEVRRALERFAEGMAGFSDLLIVESGRAADCKGLATFDRKLLRLPEGLEP